MTSSRSADGSPKAMSASRGYGRLARSITAWTSNLLATAIVLVGGIALGWQVLAWWGEDMGEQVAAPLSEALIEPFQGGEFTTVSGEFKAEQLEGDEAAAFAAMRAWCLETTSMADADEPGPGEAELLASLAAEQPLEVAGDLALYEPPERVAGLPPMLIAVSRSCGRIVAWSFALPASDLGPLAPREEVLREASAEPATPPLAERGGYSGAAIWSLYHFRPAVPGTITTVPEAGNNMSAEPHP